MLTTKARTTIITLIASFSLAAVAAPTIAQADTKSGGSTPTQQETCDKLYGEFERWVNIAEALYNQEGNGGTFNAALDTAESTLHAAENTGCDWAARVQPPARRFAIATTAGTLHVSTVGSATVSPVRRVSSTTFSTRL